MARVIGLRVQIIGTDQQVKELSRLERGLKDLSIERNKLLKADKEANEQRKKNLDQQKKINELAKGSSVDKRNAIKLSKDLLAQEQKANNVLRQNTVAVGANRDKTLQLQNSKRRLESTIRSKIRADQTSANTMERVRGVLSKLKNEIEKVDISTKKGRKDFERLATAIKLNETKVRDFNQALGRGRTFVGEYARGAVSAFKQVAAAAGIAFGIAGIIRFGREIITIGATFQQSMANLGAVSRASGEDLKALEELAQELGRTSVFTASQVGDLEVALARLGFTPEQIIKSAEAVSLLAAATGEDLAASAKVAASNMRAFGLEVDEMQRVVDVMALTFASASFELDTFATAMKNVAPVARSVGLSIEETSALLAQLVNAGFDASQAGTALRNILLKVKDPTQKLGTALGVTVKNGKDLIQGFKNLSASGIDLGDALALTDRRSVAAFKQFLATADAADELTDALNNAAGAAEAAAKIQLATLTGDLKLLTSAIQGVVIDGFNKMSDALRSIVQGLIRFIKFLQDNATVIKNITKGITLLTAAVFAYNIAIKLSGALTAAWATVMGIANGSITVFSIGVKLGTIAMRIFNAVIKLNPIGLLVGAITAVAGAFFLFSESADEATESQDKLNKSMTEGAEAAAKLDRTFDGVLARFFKFGDLQKLISSQSNLAGLSLKELGAILTNVSEQLSEVSTTDFEFSVITAQGERVVPGEATEEAKKSAAERIKILKEFQNTIQKIIDQRTKTEENTRNLSLKDLINNQKSILALIEKGGQEEIDAKIKLVELERDLKLEAIGLTNSEEQLIIARSKAKILALEKQSDKLILDEQKKSEKLKLNEQKFALDEQKFALNAQIELLEEGSKARSVKEIKLLELEFEKKLLAIKRGGEQEKALRQKLQLEISDILRVQRAVATAQEIKDIQNTTKRVLIELDKRLIEEPKKAKEIEDAKRKQLLDGINQTRDILRSRINEIQNDLDSATAGINLAEKILSPEEKAKLEQRLESLKLQFAELGLEYAQITQNEEGEEENLLKKLGLDDEGIIKFQAAQELAVNLISSLSNIFTQLSNRRLKEIQRERNASLERFDDEIEAAEAQGLSTRALLIQRGIAETKFEQKRREEEKRANKRAKALAISQAIISTANAVISAFAAGSKFSVIGGVIAAAAAAALGAVQIGIIASEPLKKGGKIEKGKRGLIAEGGTHEQGGIGLYDWKSGTFLPQEIEGGEPVLTAAVGKNPAAMSIISDVNEAFGGVKLARKGTIVNGLLQSGGIVNRQQVGQSQPFDIEGLLEAIDERTEVKISRIEVINNATSTERVATGVRNVQAENTF